LPLASLLLLVGAGSVRAQVLTAYDDAFGIPYGVALEVEAFGVLDNDLLDGENAGEFGATAELVADVTQGTLVLSSNGAFTYSPGPTFDGADSFIYRAVFDAPSSQATVTLTACTGGPDVFVCWNESAFRAKAAEHGYSGFQEGFEDEEHRTFSEHGRQRQQPGRTMAVQPSPLSRLERDHYRIGAGSNR